MIVQNIKIYNSYKNAYSFKSKNKENPERLERIGYADSDTEGYTDYLREHILSQTLPPKELYSRMSEYELNKYLEKIIPPIVRNKDLSPADLDNLLTYGIRKIEGTQNSYRGPRAYSNNKLLQPLNLKLVFADRVVDDVFVEENTEELVKFITTMQSDNVFVGCLHGTDQTDHALLINQYFNPLSKDTKHYMNLGVVTWDTFETICDKVMPEQKSEMKWTPEFETKLREKINNMREYYF